MMRRIDVYKNSRGKMREESKLAVMEIEAGAVPDAVVATLRELGFEVARFGAAA